MGFFDFLLKRKNQADGQTEEQKESVVEGEYKGRRLIAETSFSKTYEEQYHNFEYIDFKIVGTANYQKEIKRVIKKERDIASFSFEDPYDGMTNKEIREESYGEKIFQYDDALFSEASLVLEPDNEYDPKAMQSMFMNESRICSRKRFFGWKKIYPWIDVFKSAV